MKKVISILLVLALLLTGVSVTEEKQVEAATALDVNAGNTEGAVSQVKGVNFDIGNIQYSGDIGNIKWGIDTSGVFAFYHSDATPEKRITSVSGVQTYSDPTKVPWNRYRSSIKYVTLANLDSYISFPSMDYFFFECSNLLEVIMLPASATTMNHTFYMDVNLTSVGCVLPQAQNMNSCFQGCKELNVVIMTKNPTECKNAFYRTSCNVIVIPDIYDEDSPLATDSKCSNYYKMNYYQPTLYGISKSQGCTVDSYKSDCYVSPIRYGQAISDAEVGSTGGLRLLFTFGQSSFRYSVYLPCEITKMIRSSRNWNEVLDVGTHTNVLDIKMQAVPTGVFDAVVPSSFYHTTYKSIVVEKCQLELCSISLSQTAFTYDGSAKTPAVTLTNPYNSETLVKGKDYTVTYENQVNAGTAKVTVTGIGNYTGSVSRNYSIGNANFSDGITASGYSGTYDGNAHGIQVSVSRPASGSTVKYGTSSGNYSLSSSPTYTNVGTYTVYYQVTAANYNTFSGSETVRISPKSMGNCSIADIAAKTYDGKPYTPEPVVTDGAKTLTKGTDYQVTYSSNTNAGTATVTVTGQGNYTGSKSKTFTIRPLSLQSGTSSVNGAVRLGSVVYSGKTQKPSVSIVLGAGTVLLKEGTDYELSGNTAVNVGKGTVSVSGKGNYTGTVSASYTITVFPMDGLGEKMVLDQEELIYTGEELHPGVRIQDAAGNILTEKKDYRLEYTDAVNVGTAKVKAVFQGNYSGSLTKSYYIKPATVSDVELSEDEFVYNGKEHRPTAKGFYEGTDYEVTYRDNVNAGTALAIYSFRGNHTGTVTKEFVICPRKIEGDIVFPNAETLVYEPGLTVSASHLSETENEYGRFCWEEPDEEVEVKNSGFSVRFTPFDLDNYDWSGVPGWDYGEKAVIRQIPLIVQKAQGELPAFTVSCLAEGDFLDEAEILSESESGEFFWPDQKVLVSPDISTYSLAFKPNDSENYDWSSVGEWDVNNDFCRLSCNVIVIRNPEASCVREGDQLSSSILSSDQEGATYEWEDPDIIVMKSDGLTNTYRAVYHYQGYSLVRNVSVPIWIEPIPTQTPLPTQEPTKVPTAAPTGKPVQTTVPALESPSVPGQKPTETPTGVPTKAPAGTSTGKPIQTTVPASESPSIPGQKPTETPAGVPTKAPAGTSTGKPIQTTVPVSASPSASAQKPTETPGQTATALPSPKETQKPMSTLIPTKEPSQVQLPLPDSDIQMSGDSVIEQESDAPNAYEMIDKYISAKLLVKARQNKGINAAKTIKKSKIKVKWLVKRKTVIRLKKGKKLRLRIKGVSKKKKLPWRLRNKKIVSVSKKGLLTAKKKGRTRVTVRIRKKKYTCIIKVK